MTWHGTNGDRPPHAAVRAAERYGITLTLADLDAMMLAIMAAKLREPSTAVLQRFDRDREIWFVDAPGSRVRVVYCAINAWVMTVLPLKDEDGKLKRGALRRQAGRCRRDRPVEEVWA